MRASFSWRWRLTKARSASISAVCAAIQAAVKASSAAAFVNKRSSGVAKTGVVETRGACGVQANSLASVCVTRGVSAASKKSSTLSLPPSDTLGAGVRLGFACCGAAFFSMFVTSVRARRRLALGVAVVAIGFVTFFVAGGLRGRRGGYGAVSGVGALWRSAALLRRSRGAR